MLLRLQALVVVIVACLGVAPALAAGETTYEGTVGASRVVMELSDGTGDVSGRYFYLKVRLDIDLAGKRSGSALDLTSNFTEDHLSLTRSGEGLTGWLTTAKGRRFAVALHPAQAPATRPADFPAGLALYEQLRLSGLALTPQSSETLKGKAIRWYRESLTGIRLFRIESGYAPPALAAMNLALGRHQWSEVSDALQCTGTEGKSGMDTAEADKPWLGPDYVSYIWHSAWDCAGAAHPDFSTTGYSFDARDGHELKLDEVLPFGTAQIPAENSDAWLDYRSKVFAPAVVALLKRSHPKEMTPPADPDDCNYADPDVWDFPNWAIAEKGLWLGAIFPRVMRPCDAPEWAVIPWSDLHLRRGAKP